MLTIKKCSNDDIDRLTLMNKQLIEDEKSDNKMTLSELHTRMQGFLDRDYDAYFFLESETIVGYALVNHSANPLYLRQFLIDRQYRKQHVGTAAFNLLLNELKVNTIDIEVLSWNTTGMRFWEKCGFTERSRYMRYEENDGHSTQNNA